METVFDVRHLSKTYQTGDVNVSALRDVTLTVPAGELVVLLGPCGSGKSTLFNILGGLDVPSSGQVEGARPAQGVGRGAFRREGVKIGSSGRSAGFPSGVPVSTHRTIVSISACVSRGVLSSRPYRLWL